MLNWAQKPSMALFCHQLMFHVELIVFFFCVFFCFVFVISFCFFFFFFFFSFALLCVLSTVYASKGQNTKIKVFVFVLFCFISIFLCGIANFFLFFLNKTDWILNCLFVIDCCMCFVLQIDDCYPWIGFLGLSEILVQNGCFVAETFPSTNSFDCLKSTVQTCLIIVCLITLVRLRMLVVFFSLS